jgi:hypothetical protein
MGEWDLAASVQIARVKPVLCQVPNLAGILCIGSAALGYADYFSDVDLLCIWSAPLARPERYLLARQINDANAPAPQQIHGGRFDLDRLRIDNREVELLHVTLSTLDHHIHTLLNDPSFDSLPVDCYGLWQPLPWLQYGIPITTIEPDLQELQRLARNPPENLWERIITLQFNRLRMPVLYHLYKAAMRGDSLFLHTVLEDIVTRLLCILFAFHHRFFPSTRWAIYEMEKLPAKPKHFTERLIALEQTPSAFSRDLLPAIGQLLLEVSQIVVPWFPDAVPAWAQDESNQLLRHKDIQQTSVST